jgi:hypothetical protein
MLCQGAMPLAQRINPGEVQLVTTIQCAMRPHWRGSRKDMGNARKTVRW